MQSTRLVVVVVIEIIDGVAGAIHFIVIDVSAVVVVVIVVSDTVVEVVQSIFFLLSTLSLQLQSTTTTALTSMTMKFCCAPHSHVSRHPMCFHVNITIFIAANIIANNLYFFRCYDHDSDYREQYT